MIRMKSIPIYKEFANHSRSTKIPCVFFGQLQSSLELQAAKRLNREAGSRLA